MFFKDLLTPFKNYLNAPYFHFHVLDLKSSRDLHPQFNVNRTMITVHDIWINLCIQNIAL
jgi:hypothetical protein